MRSSNPYQPPAGQLAARNSQTSVTPSSCKQWALRGFLVGALPSIAYGIYLTIQFRQYVATLPSGSGVCGMPMLAALGMIVVVSPVSGLIGAATGFVAAVLVRSWCQFNRCEQDVS